MIALFFDTETTGFKTATFTPEIVQIAAILQDTDSKRVLGELNMIVKPDKPIPPRVAEIHGITDELAALYGIHTTTAERIFHDLARMSDVVVAHNIAFDLGIVNGVWPIASKVLNRKEQFCTMRNATNVIKLPGGRYHGEDFARHKPPKLIEAYRHFFGSDFEGAHDAMSDVRACRDVFFKLHELKPEESDPQMLCEECNQPINPITRGHVNIPDRMHAPVIPQNETVQG